MHLTRKCFGCKEDIRKDEMIQYSSLSGKTSHWYCRSCYEERMERERFQTKVCEIFGIKSPGPVIWTQRKKLQETYGYTDDAIINCLDYIYNVEHKKILSESLVLVNPRSMSKMKAWKSAQKAQASGIAAAIANTQVNEHVISVRENTTKKKEINLDDALLD